MLSGLLWGLSKKTVVEKEGALGSGNANGRPAGVSILPPPPRGLARGCLRPRLAAPELHAAAVRAFEGRHVPAARAA